MAEDQARAVQAYVRLVRSAEALHGQVSRGLFVEGLSASQFSAMKALRMNGRLAQRDIARHILKTGGNTTVLVDKLESLGLVVRDRDLVDRRVIFVSLTKKGEDLFDSLYPPHLERIAEAMAQLTDLECDLLLQLLRKVSPDSIEPACGPDGASPLSPKDHSLPARSQ